MAVTESVEVPPHWMPTVALIGRPNVGKSTLFNALTRTRDALVANMPGVTRDRQYGVSRVYSRPFIVCDTGGVMSDAAGLDAMTVGQVELAIKEADLLLFMVDARDGLTVEDQRLVGRVRAANKPTLLVVNKVDGLDEDTVAADFYQLGFSPMVTIAAEHRRGLNVLFGHIEASLDWPEQEQAEELNSDLCRLTIVGRPNTGKSTLVNRLLGEERVLASDIPGTTRDVVRCQLSWRGREYELIDTAGVRRKSRVDDAVEKFSALKTIRALQGSHVAVVMIDGAEGITDQDLTILAMVLDSGRAAVVAVNKWDDVDRDERSSVRNEVARRLNFAPFLDVIQISALHGSGLGELMIAVDQAWKSATREMRTPELTKLLTEAVARHQPPMKQGRIPRLRYAHAGGHNPPRIVIHGNRVDTVAESYRRYLSNMFREALKIRGTPLLIEFKGGGNPYEGRKNPLTARQINKRKRLKKFVKRKR
ncbi:MAG: GTPase Der [Lysobacteraceae bacterium]|nr:MAG: GTPase Der [Xanthomonadaceae bacterium]